MFQKFVQPFHHKTCIRQFPLMMFFLQMYMRMRVSVWCVYLYWIVFFSGIQITITKWIYNEELIYWIDKWLSQCHSNLNTKCANNHYSSFESERSKKGINKKKDAWNFNKLSFDLHCYFSCWFKHVCVCMCIHLKT